MKNNKVMLISCAVLILAGCSTRVADFTIMSSKNIDLTRGADFVRSPTRIKAEDRRSIIILFPTGEPNVKEAMDRAIESVPGAIGLLDGVITHNGWYIPYIYGEFWYEVEGTPLLDPVLLKSYK